MRAWRETEDECEIPLTPLIDVVFLLLIFFLVATNFTRKELDQQVKLPRAEGGARETAPGKQLVINLRAGGEAVVSGRLVSDADLRRVVADWRAENPNERVVLRGDESVRYGRFAQVMGLCRALGVTNVDLPVEDSPSGG